MANRQRFHSRLCEILAETEAQGGHLAVLCVDLSDFRELSNAFGAEVGDHILKTVGGRIESFAGAKVVGRVATDVFTVALREIDSPIDALEKAQALCGRSPSRSTPTAEV
ncbi:MAG: diguanylate cyclase [Aliidongia sp.]